jgi:N-acetylneuraminic acid mutarotase
MRSISSLILSFLTVTFSLSGFTVSNYTFTLNSDSTSYTITDFFNHSGGSGPISLPSIYNSLPVTGIGDEAFWRSPDITEVIIPTSIQTIGFNAFGNCVNLTNVSVHSGIEYINQRPFVQSPLVNYHYSSNGLKYLISTDGSSAYMVDTESAAGDIVIPSSINGATLKNVASFMLNDDVTSVTIPEGITYLPDLAFDRTSSLTSVSLPSSLQTLGWRPFYAARLLQNVTIPDGVSSIEERAFSNCSDLESVTIPDSVSSIGTRAFEGCTSLTNISIPDSVTSIESLAFFACTSLASVTFAGDAPTFGSDIFDSSNSVTIYYDSSKSGWSNTIAGRPAIPYVNGGNSGLIAYYPFNGNANDESGNEINGQTADHVSFSSDRFGNPNSALRIEGERSNIDGFGVTGSGMHLRDSSVSISFWYQKQVDDYHDWVIGVGDSGDCWIVNIDYAAPTGIGWGVWYDDDFKYNLDPPLALEQWCHVVVTYDKNDTKKCIYVDGELVSEGYTDASFTGTSNFKFGASGITLDDLRFYNRALSPSEVSDIYNADFVGEGSVIITNEQRTDLIADGYIEMVSSEELEPSWSATSLTDAPSARYNHSAIWTGSEMIIWGGRDAGAITDRGYRYDPETDTWSAISSVDSVNPVVPNSAVWTGSEMIVWGLNSGARYNPETDSWSPISNVNQPSLREEYTTIWTGSEMIVWGGSYNTYRDYLRTGARYNPTTDTWTETSIVGAPSARRRHTAIWTGSKMIIWGGRQGGAGALYDPATDTWTSMSETDAPTARDYSTASWTGSEMIVWGGSGVGGADSSGGRYDPLADTWTATTNANAPEGRAGHTSVWTGSEILIWGGYGQTAGYNAVGARYDPIADKWTDITQFNDPDGRSAHTTIWTGSEMIVWGGSHVPSDRQVIINTGGRYRVTDPVYYYVKPYPNNVDTDGDGLSDDIETNTGVFVSITDTGTDPNSADRLHTPSEMTTARTESRTLGQTDVTGNPSQYGLATPAEVASSRTAGQQDVISSPSDYNLMGAEGVFDMRVSQPGISTDGDQASMNFTIQSSNDLLDWNNEETIQREYTMPSDKNFMRVSVGPEIEPEPETLPAIATDTYGDKLVYDESNKLYVNDENTPLIRDGIHLRTDIYPGWNFYAIESTNSGYLCLLKNANQNAIITFSQDGNYLSVSVITDLSAYESDFGQSLN